jgi:flagellar hook-associated protein 3 FlgL
MFRVTPFSIAQTTVFYNRNHLAQMATLQRQLASGLKYQRPSDNPLATAQIRSRQAIVSGLELQTSQIGEANLQLNQSVSQLLDAENLMTRAYQIALDAPQQIEPAARQALITEVDSIIERMTAIINARDGKLYAYSGTATTTEPLVQISRHELAVPLVSYQGSQVRQAISLSESVSVDIRYTAQEIFFGQTSRQSSLYFGDTGAAAGTGTDSGIGRAILAVTHTTTTYEPGSGIAPGTSSDAGDTVIGPPGAHVLSVKDDSGT